MATNTTQFCVAILAVAGMVGMALLSVWGAAFGNGDRDLAITAMAGLTGVTGPAVAFLFRLNGRAKGD